MDTAASLSNSTPDCRLLAGTDEFAHAPATFCRFFDIAVDTPIGPTYQTPLAARRVALRFGEA
jgi:hypothetical protein